MKFAQAYEIAMQKSAEFRKHDARVKEAVKNGTGSACLAFSVSAGESFYYGFDGVDLHSGRYPRKRAAELMNRGSVLLII